MHESCHDTKDLDFVTLFLVLMHESRHTHELQCVAVCCKCVAVFSAVSSLIHGMGWLRLVGSLKL